MRRVGAGCTQVCSGRGRHLCRDRSARAAHEGFDQLTHALMRCAAHARGADKAFAESQRARDGQRRGPDLIADTLRKAPCPGLGIMVQCTERARDGSQGHRRRPYALGHAECAIAADPVVEGRARIRD